MKAVYRNALRYCVAASFLLVAMAAAATPLDDYVAAPDPAFTYDDTPARVEENPGYKASVYHMVSQNWLDKTKVDRTAWEHWVGITEPAEMEHTKALLFINGGSNRGTEPPDLDSPLNQVAVMTKSMVVNVGQIPNQPIKFADEQMDKYKEKGRVEDAQIAYCWDKFLRDGDPLWLSRLPMTKAVVRAMDMVQAKYPQIDGFFVAGGSKRGWTTWTVAAVDKRVIGIAPAVIDVLNVAKSMQNHHDAYGFWAPSVGNYEEMDVLSRIHTPEFRALEAIVDPYSYLDRLTMPKYVLNSAGDQFFCPDSSKFYFDDLQGEKYLRYTPNTDHGLNAEAYFCLASFYHAVMTGTPRPEFSWKKEADGTLVVHSKTPVEKAVLWQAHNPKARDFRLEEIGEAYTSSPLEESEPGVFRARPESPATGYTAFLIELHYPNPNFAVPFRFSTGVSIIPDTLPFAKTESK